MKIPFLFVLLFLGTALAEETAGDSAIVEFSDRISIQLLARYHYASFSGKSTDDKDLATNRPVDLGIGGGYGDWTWSSLFTILFGADSEKRPTCSSTISATGFSGICF